MTSLETRLPKRWSAFDFGIYAFLAINPLVLGLWLFSLSPLVGGNLFLGLVLAGVVMLLAAGVYGSLAGRWPWTGGDYAWQTRLLNPRAGAILALTSWWVVVALLAPVYGNLINVQVVQPILADTSWDGLASWFDGREGHLACSLIAIALGTAFVGLGMRRAAIAQRLLAVVGGVAFVVMLALLLTSSPADFGAAFDERAAELHGTDGVVSSQIVEIGKLDADTQDVRPVETLLLVPLILLFGLWLGAAGPLAGEVRVRSAEVVRAVLVRVAAVATLSSLLVLVALGRGPTWELWSEANSLYWNTLYGTAGGTPLPAWPNPVVFASWLSDSAPLRILLIAGMAAWVIGFAATLFLAATRVLLAAAADNLLPPVFARTTGDSVPLAALAALVLPACVLAAADAYWDAFAEWSAVAVVPLGLTTLASGVTAVVAFRRTNRGVAAVSALFTVIVSLVVAAWVLDPVYGLQSLGSAALVAAVYAFAALLYATKRRRYNDAVASADETRVSPAS